MILMMTWQIMIGAQLISVLLSAGTVVSFMLKKEPLDKEYTNEVPMKKKLANTTI